jgi:transcriptional regulator with XRE-family HTH domain
MSEQNPYEYIARRIRFYRVERGITQEDLANGVGLGRTSITNIEKGRQNVGLIELYQIAKVLNVSIYNLLPVYETGDGMDTEALYARATALQSQVKLLQHRIQRTIGYLNCDLGEDDPDE